MNNEKIPAYRTKQVADVCLNCKLKKCKQPAVGCAEYKMACRQFANHSRATFFGRKWNGGE